MVPLYYSGGQSRNGGIHHFFLFLIPTTKSYWFCFRNVQPISLSSHIFIANTSVWAVANITSEASIWSPYLCSFLYFSPISKTQIWLCPFPQHFLVTFLCPQDERLYIYLTATYHSTPPLTSCQPQCFQAGALLHFYGSSFHQWNYPFYHRLVSFHSFCPYAFQNAPNRGRYHPWGEPLSVLTHGLPTFHSAPSCLSFTFLPWRLSLGCSALWSCPEPLSPISLRQLP